MEKEPLLLPYTYILLLYFCMITKIWVRRYNNLLAEKKNKEIHILEILIF